MQRYLNGVIKGLEANQIPFEVVEPKSKGLKAKYIDYPLLARKGRKKNGRHLIISERYAYLIPFMGKKSIVVCHDLHTLYKEAQTPSIHQKIYRFFLANMLKAEKVVCVSEHSRSDLICFEPRFKDHSNLCVVHNGVEDFWINNQPERINNSRLTELFNEKRVLLSVGTDAWYKNNQWSLRFLAGLNEEFHLLRIGKFSSENSRLIESLNLNSRITQLEGISDSELKFCYQNAEALLFPSISEGFGWPALEAALCGCKVISDGHGATHEVFSNTSDLIRLEKAEDALVNNLTRPADPTYLTWSDQVNALIA